jgi:hypothetical protein
MSSKGAPRYLAIYTNDGKRHHVEMYSPQQLLDPEKNNVYIWSAHNLKEVRNKIFFVLIVGALVWWCLVFCVVLIVGALLVCCVGMDNVFGFF